MGLDPYVWGADNVRDLVTNARLHLSDDSADREKAEQNTADAEERWNAKGQES